VKKLVGAAVLLALCLSGANVAMADDITADVLTYNAKTKIATAEGNVVAHANEGAEITGKKGEYHFSDRSAFLTGGVHYVKQNTTLDADTMYLYADKTIHGTGSVVYIDKDENRSLKGDDVTYNPDTGHGNIEGHGYVSSPDGEVSAPHIEGNLKEIRILATGGVTFKSELHQLTGSGDQALYTKSPDENNGVLVLSGNAEATQNGNHFAGPELVMKEGDQTVETRGRSTLTITNTSGVSQ
jgi:lipopolysaccharide export system protein LptA